jgi:hypothetical protein
MSRPSLQLLPKKVVKTTRQRRKRKKRASSPRDDKHFCEKSSKNHEAASKTKKTRQRASVRYAIFQKKSQKPQDSVENENKVQMRRPSLQLLSKKVVKTTRQRRKRKKRASVPPYDTHFCEKSAKFCSRSFVSVGRGDVHNGSTCRKGFLSP